MGDELRAAQLEVLLGKVRGGDAAAASELAALVHGELHGMARQFMADQRPSHTLQPTALVNEAWMKLAKGRVPTGRAHFLRLAASCMRSILVDHARARSALKRAGGERVSLEQALEAGGATDGSAMLALHEALERIAETDEPAARVAEMRLFGGMEHAEVAEALDVSHRTVDRLWSKARERLESELEF